MVGPPRTLEDLRKVEGAVRVRCHACKRVQLLDREELIHRRFHQRLTTDWMTVRQDLSCGSCKSANVRVDGVPFSEDAAELRRRRVVMATIGLALAILSAAAYPSGQPPIMPEAVRLALRALHPHLRDRSALTDFWTLWTKDFRLAHENPCRPLSVIITDLVAGGYAVPAEHRWLAR